MLNRKYRCEVGSSICDVIILLIASTRSLGRKFMSTFRRMNHGNLSVALVKSKEATCKPRFVQLVRVGITLSWRKV